MSAQANDTIISFRISIANDPRTMCIPSKYFRLESGNLAQRAGNGPTLVRAGIRLSTCTMLVVHTTSLLLGEG